MKLFTLLILALTATSVFAGDIQLPQPNRAGGMPLMEALNNRRSAREFSPENISEQKLSDLLWAMWGISREDGRRTAPTARNDMAIELYVMKNTGIFRYNAQENILTLVLEGDHRDNAGTHGWVRGAPLNIFIVHNLNKMRVAEEVRVGVANMDAGFVAQNAYLFCASAGLNTVVRMMIPRDEIRALMGWDENMYPSLAMTVGYPVGGPQVAAPIVEKAAPTVEETPPAEPSRRRGR